MGARAFIKLPLACNGPRAVRAGFEEYLILNDVRAMYLAHTTIGAI